MIEHKLFKVTDEFDPRRCQSNISGDQCPYIREEGSDYCMRHTGKSNGQAKESRNYQLAIWQSRVNQFADNNQVKSLREEIGILRLVLEKILLKCQNDNDIFLYSSKISDHVTKIEKVVTSCHRLEEKTNLLLDKSAILQLAGTFVEIISRHILDALIIEKIQEEMLTTIMEAQLIEK